MAVVRELRARKNPGRLTGVVRGSGIRESNPRPASPNDLSPQILTTALTDDFAQTFARESPDDPDLALILERWPALPEPIKAAIRALVGTVAGPS
jgi:hypothetical protein